jgi:nucleoside-diphosphate-sugar epimerase
MVSVRVASFAIFSGGESCLRTQVMWRLTMPCSVIHINSASSTFAAIDLPHEFVFVPDVGPVVLDLAAKPEAYGHWWNFAGAGSTTQREIVDKVFRMAGRAPKIRVAGKTMLRIFGLFKPVIREMVEMNYLITTPVLMDDRALGQLLGPVYKTPYSEGLTLTYESYVTARSK